MINEKIKSLISGEFGKKIFNLKEYEATTQGSLC